MAGMLGCGGGPETLVFPEYPVLMAIRNTDTAGREKTCQPTLSAPPPAGLLPFPSGQQRFSRHRGLIRDVVFAALSLTERSAGAVP